jgi:FKBP-type peptidyl-prolyl cis-trans isomerase FklB
MKAVFLLFLLPSSVCFGQIKKPKPTAVMTSTDSLSYSIGVQVAEYYKTQGVEKLNTEYVAKAFNVVLNHKTLIIPEDECNMNIQQKLQQFMTQKISTVKESGLKFLE